MADRKKLQEELNRINELYHQTDLDMNKAGGSMQQRQQLRDMLNKKKESLIAELGDDLSTLNAGKAIKVGGAASNVAKNSNVLKMLGKKALGVIPMAGTVAGLMAGDPAMAAEEAAGDIPVLGQAYEAIKPTESGNPEEERLMLAEDQARKNYAKSPARFNRLNNMIKK
jgi:predicted NodU family carbamoyl transferase